MIHDSLHTQNILARVFPPPEYLSMPAIGVDISDTAIKYVGFTREHGVPDIRMYGKRDLPLDVIEGGEIADRETITKVLSRLREEYDFLYAHLSLPEEHAYLFQITAPKGTQREIRSFVEAHLKENVPVGSEDAVFDYSVMREGKKDVEVNVSVYPALIAYQYVHALEAAGVMVLSAEIEGQATARAVLTKDTKETVLIVDIGRNDSSLSISTNGFVTFTAGLETGGDDFTRAIARSLDVSFKEAEKLKREHGFTDTKESSMTYNALLPVVQELAESIKKHLVYWQVHTVAQDAPMARVVFTGGAAHLRGLVEYIAAVVEVPVEVGNVWVNLYDTREQVPPVHASEALEYATSIGLALRSVERGC